MCSGVSRGGAGAAPELGVGATKMNCGALSKATMAIWRKCGFDKIEHEIDCRRRGLGTEGKRIGRLKRNAGRAQRVRSEIQIGKRPLEHDANPVERRQLAIPACGPDAPGYRHKLLFPVTFDEPQLIGELVSVRADTVWRAEPPYMVLYPEHPTRRGPRAPATSFAIARQNQWPAFAPSRPDRASRDRQLREHVEIGGEKAVGIRNPICSCDDDMAEWGNGRGAQQSVAHPVLVAGRKLGHSAFVLAERPRKELRLTPHPLGAAIFDSDVMIECLLDQLLESIDSLILSPQLIKTKNLLDQ